MWFWQAMQALSVLHVSGNRLTHVRVVSKRHALIQRCNMNDTHLFFQSDSRNIKVTRTFGKLPKIATRNRSKRSHTKIPLCGAHLKIAT